MCTKSCQAAGVRLHPVNFTLLLPSSRTNTTTHVLHREYCSTKREKDDPSMEEEGVEWNELRAGEPEGGVVVSVRMCMR